MKKKSNHSSYKIKSIKKQKFRKIYAKLMKRRNISSFTPNDPSENNEITKENIIIIKASGGELIDERRTRRKASGTRGIFASRLGREGPFFSGIIENYRLGES